jgi:hypothetical protein
VVRALVCLRRFLFHFELMACRLCQRVRATRRPSPCGARLGKRARARGRRRFRPVPAQMWEIGPGPGADVEGASSVPVQMWQGATAGRAQSRCRCGRGGCADKTLLDLVEGLVEPSAQSRVKVLHTNVLGRGHWRSRAMRVIHRKALAENSHAEASIELL